MAENKSTAADAAAADEAETPLEAAVRRARARMPVPPDPSTWATIDAVLANLALAAYCVGGAEAYRITPWECMEMVWRTEPPTPEQLSRYTAQGWRPWDMANVVLPKVKGFDQAMGYRVRFTRPMQQAPAPVVRQEPEKAGA